MTWTAAEIIRHEGLAGWKKCDIKHYKYVTKCTVPFQELRYNLHKQIYAYMHKFLEAI